MEKISIKNLDSKGVEILSQEDLKRVMGGGPPTDDQDRVADTWICACSDGTRYSVFGRDIREASDNAASVCSNHNSGPMPDTVCQPY